MQTPPLQLVGLVARAAELRAAGQSWEQVARAVQRGVDTVKKWPSRYADYWNQLLAEARRISIESAGDEARAALRVHLRSDKDASSRDAAKQLIHHQATLTKTDPSTPLTDLQRFFDYLEELTDDDLNTLLGAYDRVDTVRTSGDSNEATSEGCAA
jgi:hypothetical protein